MTLHHDPFALFRRDPTRRAARRLELHVAALRKALPTRERLMGGLEHAATALAGALLAYAPPAWMGLPESYWAPLTAISVVQATFGPTRSGAQDQVAGAAVGAGIGTVIAMTGIGPLPAFALGLVGAVLACWLLNVSTAARLAGTTATIILLVPHPAESAGQIALARVGEVGWGVAVALAVVGVATLLIRHGEGTGPAPTH